MDTRSPAPAGAAGAARWLGPQQLEEVSRLLAGAFPDSGARPGTPGVRRWAGVRDADGRLVAIAADAWTAPGIGFVAGVATEPRARRRGHGASACRLVIDTLVGEQGRAALMVDAWNSGAIWLYQRLGLRHRAVAAARVKAGPARPRPPAR
jgi:ribosomal protein S18 acetylase RimI-like enzyme